jgi:cell division protein FtsB
MALPASKKGKKHLDGGTKEKSKPLRSVMGKLPAGIFWLILLMIGASLGGLLVFGNRGLYHLYQMHQEKDKLVQENLTIKDENERLVKTIERLQNDQEFIEDVIRKELNYIKKNEIIYQLEPEVGGQQITPPENQARRKVVGTTRQGR